jgi:hypothetical protein
VVPSVLDRISTEQIIYYVSLEFFCYGAISDCLHSKLEKLNEQKSKLDVYFLKKSEKLDLDNIFEEYLVTKFYTPRIGNLWGVVWYVLPWQMLSEQEMYELLGLLIPTPDFVSKVDDDE